MSLPERINVIRTVTYDVSALVDNLQEMNDDPNYQPDLEDIMSYIEDWVYEDMTSPLSRHDVVYQDENGNEL